jgi:hypothetical protein
MTDKVLSRVRSVVLKWEFCVHYKYINFMHDSLIGELNKCHIQVIYWILLLQPPLYTHIRAHFYRWSILTLPRMISCVSPSCGPCYIYMLLSHQKWVFHVTFLFFYYVGIGHRNMTNPKWGQVLRRVQSAISRWELFSLSSNTSCEMFVFVKQVALQSCVLYYLIRPPISTPIRDPCKRENRFFFWQSIPYIFIIANSTW